MRLPLLIVLILILVNTGIDVYIYKALRQRCTHRWPSMVQLVGAVAMLVMVIVAISLPRRGGNLFTLLAVMWMLYGYFSVYIPKALFVITDLVARIPQLFKRHRVKWLSLAGGVIAMAVFVAMWWGALVTRNSMQVKEVTVEIPNLPAGLDGLTIAQISDLHVGTWGTDTTAVSRMVDRINSLAPDVIVFTGDIVNSRSSELEPFVAPLSRLKSPGGVLSILGNHDYGDYSSWPSPEAKRDNLKLLFDLQKQMRWTLLRDSTVMLPHNGDTLAIIGVENIGDAPFPTYGSLSQAYPHTGDSLTKVLLSHNPRHWADSLAHSRKDNIALTLSGHTHAMQCEVAGISPAALRYPQWGGLYDSPETGKQLYVNIGLGTVAFPARIGATPEITLLTLKRKAP